MPAATLHVYDATPTTGITKLIVRAGAGQNTRLQEWQDAAGTMLAGVDSTGIFFRRVDTGAGGATHYVLQTGGGATRWAVGTASTESGSNAGSNFALHAYNDAGSWLSTPFLINRAGGRVLLGGATDDGVNRLQVSGNIAIWGDVGIDVAYSANVNSNFTTYSNAPTERPAFNFRHARGTSPSTAADVVVGDRLGLFIYRGYEDGDFRAAAWMDSYVTAVGSSNVIADLRFHPAGVQQLTLDGSLATFVGRISSSYDMGSGTDQYTALDLAGAYNGNLPNMIVLKRSRERSRLPRRSSPATGLASGVSTAMSRRPATRTA